MCGFNPIVLPSRSQGLFLSSLSTPISARSRSCSVKHPVNSNGSDLNFGLLYQGVVWCRVVGSSQGVVWEVVVANIMVVPKE